MDTNTYECVYIIKPGLEKSLLDTIVNRYKRLARSFQGHVKTEDWGEKALAYPLIREKEYRSGYYIQMHFDATNEQMIELETTFTADTSILKHLIIRLDPGFEYEDDPEESEQPDLYPNVKSTKKPVDVFNLIFKIEEEE